MRTAPAGHDRTRGIGCCRVGMVVGLVLISLVACGPGAGPVNGPTALPTTPPDVAAIPDLLVADETGVRVVTPTGQTRFTDQAATLAVPDLAGGVVFQDRRHQPSGIEPDSATGRNVYLWEDGGPDPILHVREPDGQPDVLVQHPDGLLTLVDVVVIERRRHVLYRLLAGGPVSDSGWDQVMETLFLLDLESGDTRPLGLVGAFESSHNVIRIGAGLLVVTHMPYGDPSAPLVGSTPLTALDELDETGWIPRLADPLVLGPGTECGSGDFCTGWALATTPPDGSRLSWVQGGVTWGPQGVGSPWPVEVLVASPGATTAVGRVDLGAASTINDDPVDRPTAIDDDGMVIVISGIGPQRAVLLVTALGQVVDLDLDGAVVSLWTENSDHT